MNEKKFNERYSEKYGEIYTRNTTEEDNIIHKDIKYISNMLNKYYDNKKVSIMTPEGIKNTEWENINNDKNNYHPYINVCCTNSLIPNAFAVKVNEEYYVGILKGLLIFLKEHIKDFVEDEAFTSIPEIGMVIPWRINHILYTNCINFLSMHEFFHINNGHCDLSKKLGIYELCEASSDIDTEYAMIIQTLEYDADCCAIASLVNEELRMYQMMFNNMQMGNFSGSVNSIIQFLSSTLIGIYIFHSWINGAYYYDNFTATEESLENMTHPLPGLRINYIALMALQVIESKGFFTEEDIKQIVDRTFNALICFIKSFKEVTNPKFIGIINTEIGIKHLQKVHDNWEQVRDLLEVHYTNLAPYKKFDYNIFRGKE